MRRTAWGNALDLKRAATNVRAEMGPSDWHLDPWGWPELSYLVTKEPDLLLQNCMGSGALEYAQIDVPKENWGTRPAVLLDITDRLMYQALVDRMSLELIGDLSKFAYGWRLPAKTPKKAIYARNGQQWDSYRGLSTTLESEAIATLESEATQTDWMGDLSGGMGFDPAAGRGRCSAASGREGSGSR